VAEPAASRAAKSAPARAERVATPLLPPHVEDTGTRRKLLDTALVLFAERGYHGVSVRDITDAVGVKASSMYAHYPSKEHVLSELLHLGHAEFTGSLRAALGAAGDEPEAQLRALVDAHVRNHATYPLLARVCADDLRGLSEENLTEILALRLEIVGLFLNAIAAGTKSGAFVETDTFLTSMAIIGMGMRVANWYSGNAAGLEFATVLTDDIAPSNRYTVDQISEHYVELALRLVAKH
jgi:AcrR family transcriptional regulator